MSGHLEIPMDTYVSRNSTNLSEEAGQRHSQKQRDSADRVNQCMLGKTPTPIYRHAAPSGPWPWMDFDEDFPVVPRTQHTPHSPTHAPAPISWSEYPQSSFQNWTENQVRRCKMLTDCPVGESNVFKVDVFHSGKFCDKGPEMATIKDGQTEAEFWEMLQVQREEHIRVRALFVKNMTKEVLKMLGERYNVEPFFFSSSTNWIPSRYQESVVPKKSDHITVILPFIRAIDRVAVCSNMLHPPQKAVGSSGEDQMIGTQSPLYLESHDKYILQDLLSVHMVRGTESSTIISYHPKLRPRTADQLHSLIRRTGRSVYWSKIFDRSKDPTCLFLCFLWYAMYEWDEVFEILYAHINHLEQLVLDSRKIRETQHLHILQAHLLYHRTLLEDFRKSIVFVQETVNPAMQNPSVTDKERDAAQTIMKRETDYMLSEIERLESQRLMQGMRLKNVMDLAFATVNIEDSKYMKNLTFATVRDSAAMKQISYLTMVFLPANFMSNVFSMNVIEINPSGGETLVHYAIGAVLLTVFASWLAIAMQVESHFFPEGSSMWRRLAWPLAYVYDLCTRWWLRRAEKQKTM